MATRSKPTFPYKSNKFVSPGKALSRVISNFSTRRAPGPITGNKRNRNGRFD